MTMEQEAEVGQKQNKRGEERVPESGLPGQKTLECF